MACRLPHDVHDVLMRAAETPFVFAHASAKLKNVYGWLCMSDRVCMYCICCSLAAPIIGVCIASADVSLSSAHQILGDDVLTHGS
jgi:hypothetical protein